MHNDRKVAFELNEKFFISLFLTALLSVKHEYNFKFIFTVNNHANAPLEIPHIDSFLKKIKSNLNKFVSDI